MSLFFFNEETNQIFTLTNPEATMNQNSRPTNYDTSFA